MSERQNGSGKRTDDVFEEWLANNSHLKWPVAIFFIFILILVILLDIYSPDK